MTNNKVRWTELLDTALTEPGKISEAFRAFHRFSFGNMLLAMSQCHHRELAMGPINTYKGWQGSRAASQARSKGPYALHAHHNQAQARE